MKKAALILALMLGTTNIYAQDYDLQGLARTINKLYPEGFDNDETVLLLEIDYNFNSDFVEGLRSLESRNGDGRSAYGFMDKFGKIVISPIYDHVNDFSEGLAFVEKNGKWGFINKSGQTVIPFIYEGTTDSDSGFRNGIAVVKKDRYLGAIDKSGKTVIPFKWEYLENTGDSLLLAARYNNGESEEGFINLSGEMVMPFERSYDFYIGFSEGIGLAGTLDKDYYIDKKGKVLFPAQNRLAQFCEGLCWYEQNSKYGFIDKTFKSVIPPIYEFVGNFHEGVAYALKGGKYGAIDKNGKTVVPFVYDGMGDCSDGLLRVSMLNEFSGKRCGFVDKLGNVVIPIKYQLVSDFSEGLAIVILNNKFGFIDKQGNSSFNPPTNTTNNTQNDSQEIFVVTETMPSFAGGNEGLQRWLSDNFEYPQEAMDKGIGGKVIASITIQEDGSIGEVEIVKSVHPLLDNATIKLFRKMPKWKPGTQNGKPVRVKMEFPLTYRVDQ